MKHNKSCTCCIVPPYIMELPDFEGDFKDSLKFTNRVHEHREEISYQIMGATLAGVNIPGAADRYIYDAKNTAKMEFQLVRKEGDPVIADAAANNVYDNAGKVRDFYKSAYNYFSVDNNGKDLIMNIHFQESLNNALWSSQSDQMFFGDGDGRILKGLTEAIDVIAHEMTHGVVEYTAGLLYQGQSGALNEHIADVFATVIKQHYKGQDAQTGSWLIGEDVVGPRFKLKQGYTNTALRSLKDPGCAFDGDPQPANMSGYQEIANDNGGVHLYSGILNKAFYLVATGDAMPVSGLDTFKAGELWFNALKAIRVDTCDFEQFAKIVVNSAKAMMVKTTLPLDSDVLVQAAFNSVGLTV